jgi:hypothetical protein
LKTRVLRESRVSIESGAKKGRARVRAATTTKRERKSRERKKREKVE